MADDILDNGAIIVTRFFGARGSRAGQRERGTCYQINEDGRAVQLTRSEMRLLIAAVERAEANEQQ
jgi:hypothetical protein